jgi:hypothetical protein
VEIRQGGAVVCIPQAQLEDLIQALKENK